MIEGLHTTIRLACMAVFVTATLLLTRSLALAFLADYGPPWARRPGANGRSAVDLRVAIYTGGFALVGLASIAGTVYTLARSGPLPLSPGSLVWTVFSLIMAVTAVDLWRQARRERRRRDGHAAHDADVQ